MPKFKQTKRGLARLQHERNRLVIPQLGPPTYQVDESYPLGDFLYNRSKAADDLIKAKWRAEEFIRRLPGADREAVEKVQRIFSKIAVDRAKLTA